MLVHQIWIGHKPAPEEWMATVRDFCRNYGHTYILWGNNEIKNLDLSKYTGLQELMDEYEHHENSYKYAGQADVLRTVILYEYGGIYIDADSVIVNPSRLDRFLHDMSSKIYYGSENKEGLIANGVIGCPKGHAYMKQCLDFMPVFAEENKEKAVWERTGPHFVTRAYTKYKDQYPGEIEVVPTHYFYPEDWHGTNTMDAHIGKTFDPDTMMFQYGYTTNSMDKHFGGGIYFWKKLLMALFFALLIWVVFTSTRSGKTVRLFQRLWLFKSRK
jgi:mannosyltransferase OCH1-like enzyme